MMLLVLAAFAKSAAPPVPPANHHDRPVPACTALNGNLPEDLTGWTRTGERLQGGHAVVLNATPAAAGASRPGGEATIAFSVTIAGVYGIALDQAGWIDVLPVMDQGAPRPLTSVAHGHGPACSTIRKIVRFQLNPGTYYSLALSGLPNGTARVMIVPPAPPAPPAPPHAH